MAQMSQNIGRANYLEEVFISNEILEPDLYFGGKIRNISSGGMNFESDCLLCPKDRINVKIPFTTDNLKTDSFRLHSAIVKWSKLEQHLNSQNVYGVEFTEPLQGVENFISCAEAKKQSLFLSNLPKIIGFTAVLTYCIKKIFFDPNPLYEPYKLIIAGLSLLGFTKFTKVIYKALKIRSS